MDTYLSHFFAIGFPAALIFACFGPYRRRALTAQGLLSSPLREWMLHLFVLCLFGLAAMILWPSYHFEESEGLWGNLVIHNSRESWTSRMNLIPFRMVGNYFHAFRERKLGYAIIQFVGNILVFFPLGFFPALLFSRFGFLKTLFFGLAFSLSAECTQFFLGRHCDVDDVILNVTGVMLGFALFRLTESLFPNFRKKCLCRAL